MMKSIRIIFATSLMALASIQAQAETANISGELSPVTFISGVMEYSNVRAQESFIPSDDSDTRAAVQQADKSLDVLRNLKMPTVANSIFYSMVNPLEGWSWIEADPNNVTDLKYYSDIKAKYPDYNKDNLGAFVRVHEGAFDTFEQIAFSDGKSVQLRLKNFKALDENTKAKVLLTMALWRAAHYDEVMYLKLNPDTDYKPNYKMPAGEKEKYDRNIAEYNALVAEVKELIDTITSDNESHQWESSRVVAAMARMKQLLAEIDSSEQNVIRGYSGGHSRNFITLNFNGISYGVNNLAYYQKNQQKKEMFAQTGALFVQDFASMLLKGLMAKLDRQQFLQMMNEKVFEGSLLHLGLTEDFKAQTVCLIRAVNSYAKTDDQIVLQWVPRSEQELFGKITPGYETKVEFARYRVDSKKPNLVNKYFTFTKASQDLMKDFYLKTYAQCPGTSINYDSSYKSALTFSQTVTKEKYLKSFTTTIADVTLNMAKYWNMDEIPQKGSMPTPQKGDDKDDSKGGGVIHD